MTDSLLGMDDVSSVPHSRYNRDAFRNQKGAEFSICHRLSLIVSASPLVPGNRTQAQTSKTLTSIPTKQ